MPPMGDEQTSKIVRIPIELYRIASGIAASRSEDTGVEVTPMAVVRAALAKGLEQLERGKEESTCVSLASTVDSPET